jgi:HNH endonuclease/AP2 domain
MMLRAIYVAGDVAFIALNRNTVAVIDAEDVPIVDDLNWSELVSKRTSYARRAVTLDGRSSTILLHRVVMRAPEHLHVDHRDGDGLNCRKANLRLATQQQNNLNTRGHADSASGIKGVRKHALCDKYVAEISRDGQRHYLGLFNTAQDAAAAYRAASERLHGEFGRTQ